MPRLEAYGTPVYETSDGAATFGVRSYERNENPTKRGWREEWLRNAGKKYDKKVADAAVAMIDATVSVFKTHKSILPNVGTKRLKRPGVARIRLRATVPPKLKSVTVTVTSGGVSGSKVVRVTG